MTKLLDILKAARFVWEETVLGKLDLLSLARLLDPLTSFFLKRWNATRCVCCCLPTITSPKALYQFLSRKSECQVCAKPEEQSADHVIFAGDLNAVSVP